jgi:predicted glycogen debranching enzyme
MHGQYWEPASKQGVDVLEPIFMCLPLSFTPLAYVMPELVVRIWTWHPGQNDLMIYAGWQEASSTGVSHVAPSLQEWLETDGLGGFASSTTLGIHTRRYHGWLFVAGRDPGERFLALSKLEDSCQDSGGQWQLSSNYYPGVTYPDGASNLWHFVRYPFPKFVFKVGKRFLSREIFMRHGVPGVYCMYRLEPGTPDTGDSGCPMTILMRPFCQNRFYHHLGREGTWSPTVRSFDGAVVIEGHHACGDLLLIAEPSTFRLDPKWYRQHVYPMERDRGLDYREDYFSPGEFQASLKPGATVVFWAGPMQAERWPQRDLRASALTRRCQEIKRRMEIEKKAPSPLLAKLDLASDQFVATSSSGKSIIAGYHWFGEWGRDSFIAMPGILIRTRRWEDARHVFLRFSSAMKEGMVPNCFQEGCGAAHNSADASLWMIRALGIYERASGDSLFVDSITSRVRDIIRSYAKGTSFGVRMDPSGLLLAGHGGDKPTQVTWMDACVGGIPVTPRAGYPVEINALWILTLFLMARWERRMGNGVWAQYRNLALSASREFVERFQWPGWGLYDCLDEEGVPVPILRPNAVIAAALLGRVLPRGVLLKTWRSAKKWLLTPKGLRTLAPFEKCYKGQYKGGPEQRDASYHQGTVWPWLLGSYYDLMRHIWPGLKGEALDSAVVPLLVSLADLDANPCMGSVPEVASGDFPYEAGGAVAQAWSVGELSRMIAGLRNGNQEVDPS